MSKLKILSLFSGIGAFEKALTRLNIPFEVVNYCEIDKYASKAYSLIHNISEDKNLGDITKIDEKLLPDFQMMTWGFPCQDISIAGKQKGIVQGETRSGLYYEGLRILREKKPIVSIIENVKNLTQKKFKPQFDQLLRDLDETGYNSYWQILNAKDYGIPQNRERVFIISIRKDKNKKIIFPEGFDNGLRLKDLLEDTVNEKYYISQDKTDKLITQLKNKDSLLLDMCQAKREGHPREYVEYAPTLNARDYKEPRLINQINIVGQISNDGSQAGKVYSTNGVFPTICACTHGYAIGNILENNNKINVIGELDIKGQDNIKRVYNSNGISPTLTNMQGGNRQPKVVIKGGKPPAPELVGGIGKINFGKQYRQGNRIYSSEKTAMCLMAQPVGNTGGYSYLYNVGYRIRKLTPKECFRLMGFDDQDFYKIKEGLNNNFYKGKDRSDSQIYKMAGNSIVVNVLEAILKILFNKS